MSPFKGKKQWYISKCDRIEEITHKNTEFFTDTS
jgi:hypothetical protein